jgi:hypothetical protein
MRIAAKVRPALLGYLLLTAACQAVAGIHEQTLQQGVEAVESMLGVCETYCDEVQKQCGDQELYRSRESCLALCAYLPTGAASADASMQPNTRECRMQKLKTLGEPQDCAIAGPSGGNSCGSKCESYCELRSGICGDDDMELCLRQCKILRDDPKLLKANTAFDGGDTLQCRFAHLSAAAQSARMNDEAGKNMHCGHSAVNVLGRRSEAMPQFCFDPTPNCDSYCDIVMAACPSDGPQAQYDDARQCQQVCGAMVMGTSQDIDDDTVGCRIYHAYATLPNQAAVHCPHAGPAGGTADGHGCGTSCESYCRLVAKSCGDAYAKQYGSGSDACLAECTTRDAGKAYSTAQSGDALQCRIYSAARAIDPKNSATKAELCQQALGQTPCR